MLRCAAVFLALLVMVGCSPDATTVPAPAPPVTGISMNAVALLAGDSVGPTVLVTVGGETRPATPGEIVVTSSDTNVIVIAANDALVAVGDRDRPAVEVRTPDLERAETASFVA